MKYAKGFEDYYMFTLAPTAAPLKILILVIKNVHELVSASAARCNSADIQVERMRCSDQILNIYTQNMPYKQQHFTSSPKT